MISNAEEIKAAFEAVCETWENDPTVIFGSEEERLKGFFASRKRRFKAWDRAGPCMYRTCSKLSIPRSHAVQRGGPLAQIAEEGHVVTPSIDQNGQLIVSETGIGKASTFPGFCAEHEALFSEFETNGKISTERHAALQMLRTVCREIARRQFDLAEGLRALDDYRTFRETYFRRSMESALPADANYRGLEVKGDSREDWAEEQLSKTRNTLRHLDLLYNAFTDYIEGKKDASEAVCFDIPIQIPVALSGIVLIDYRKRSERVRVAPCAIGVLPQGPSTLVFVGTLRQHRAFLEGWKNRLQMALPCLNLIEGWMVHGTDHWFLPPSAWHGLSEERRERIAALLFSPDGVPSATPAPSIFDDLRRQYLKELETQVSTLSGSAQTHARDELDAEWAKLNG